MVVLLNKLYKQTPNVSLTFLCCMVVYNKKCSLYNKDMM